MPVYGEEQASIDFSKGLFLSSTPDIIPNGYLQYVKNFFYNEKGNLCTRRGLTSLGSFAYTASLHPNFNIKAIIPETDDASLRFGELYGGEDLPNMWVAYAAAGAGITILHTAGKFSAGSVNAGTKQSYSGLAWNPNVVDVLDMCQYKDRIYSVVAVSASTVDVEKVTNWKYDGTTPALTRTSVVTAITIEPTTSNDRVTCFISYKNRLFISRKSRVTYTDIPTPGGYPESWNSGNNFFNLPSDGAGLPNIYRMIPLNGLLYIFTDRGIFRLNGSNSDPTTWAVEFITSSICITNKNAVALVNGVFICTDYNKLYVFNGQRFDVMGSEIQYAFSIYNSFSVCPYLDGFILSCRLFSTSGSNYVSTAPNGDASVWPSNKNLYFDGFRWTELQSIPGAGSFNESIDILFGATNKQNPINYNSSISYLISRDYTSIGTKDTSIIYYDKNAVADTFGGGPLAIEARMYTKDIILGLRAALSKVKYAYVKVFSLLPSFYTSWYRNGSNVPILNSLGGGTFSAVLTDIADNNYEVKIPGAEFNSRVNLRINTVPVTTTAGQFSGIPPTTVPNFEIKEIVVVYNTDNRNEPDGIST